MSGNDKEKSVKYAAVRAAIENGMSAMESNPVRGLRNMAELGTFFAQTDNQRGFFNFAQQMLGRKRSIYKQLAERTFNDVDHGLLKKLGLNMGYFSWTYGAQRIRRMEAECGCNIPWSIVFDMTRDCAAPLSIADVNHVIEQAHELGIYAYWLLLRGKDQRLEAALGLMQSHSDCSFVINMDASCVTSERARRIVALGNVAVSLNLDGEAVEAAAGMLHAAKCMYGMSLRYDGRNAEFILSGDFSRRALQLGCLFAISFKGVDCDEGAAELIHDYIATQKLGQDMDSPVFIIDLFEDIGIVDTSISNEPCYVEVRNDGLIAAAPDAAASGFNVREAVLIEAFKGLAACRATAR